MNALVGLRVGQCGKDKMTVKELIKKLKAYNPKQDVTVWDATQDCETTDVYLSETTEGLLIASVEIGRPMTI